MLTRPQGRITRLGAVGLILALLFPAGCQPQGERPRQQPVLVFAASSLSDILDRFAKEFTARGGAEVEISAASSIELWRQIEAGAPVDLFLSASAEPIDGLIASGLGAAADRLDLLGNRLVAVTSTARPVHLEAPRDLASVPEHVAMGDPETVPAGLYARAALRRHGLWERLADRIVPAASVRTALGYVEMGLADVGLVYATDARTSTRVRVAFTFGEESHPPIVYPALILRAAPRREAARRFLEHLVSHEAAVAFRQAGFRFLARPGQARTGP